MDGGFDGQMFSLAEVQAALSARRGGGAGGAGGALECSHWRAKLSNDIRTQRTYMDVMRTKQRECSDTFGIRWRAGSGEPRKRERGKCVSCSMRPGRKKRNK